MKRTNWQFIVDALLFISVTGVTFIGILMGFFLGEGPTGGGKTKYFLGLHRHQWGEIHLILSLAFIVLLVIHLIFAWRWIKGKAKSLLKGKWRWGLGGIVLLSVIVVFLGWAVSSHNDPKYQEYGNRSGARWQQNDQSGGQGEPQRIHERRYQKTEEAKGVDEGQKITETHESHKGREIHENHGSHETHGISDEKVGGRLSERNPEYVITGQMTLMEVETATGIPASDIARHLKIPVSEASESTLGRLRRRYGFSIQDVRDYIASRLEQGA